MVFLLWIIWKLPSHAHRLCFHPCLLVCLFVCLSADNRTNSHKTWLKDGTRAKKEAITFCHRSQQKRPIQELFSTFFKKSWGRVFFSGNNSWKLIFKKQTHLRSWYLCVCVMWGRLTVGAFSSSVAFSCDYVRFSKLIDCFSNVFPTLPYTYQTMTPPPPILCGGVLPCEFCMPLPPQHTHSYKHNLLTDTQTRQM